MVTAQHPHLSLRYSGSSSSIGSSSDLLDKKTHIRILSKTSCVYLSHLENRVLQYFLSSKVTSRGHCGVGFQSCFFKDLTTKHTLKMASCYSNTHMAATFVRKIESDTQHVE